MEQKQQKQKKPGLASFGWVIPLLIGLGFAVVFTVQFIGEAFEGFPTEPIQWDLVDDYLAAVALFFFPFALISWFMWAMRGWAKRGKRSPSLAFVVTLAFGVFIFLFSLAECIGGFASRPIEWTAVVGGLMQMATFTLPFLAVAWLLWFRPKIGAIVLICVGVAIGVWMGSALVGSALDNWTLDFLLLPALLAGIPLMLGVHTLIRENIVRKGQAKLKNAD